VGKGNNSNLVRNCLKNRFWWARGDFENWEEFNFVWTQWKSSRVHAALKTHKEAAQEDQSTADSASSAEVLATLPK
jgi:hypothetical protein